MTRYCLLHRCAPLHVGVVRQIDFGCWWCACGRTGRQFLAARAHHPPDELHEFVCANGLGEEELDPCGLADVAHSVVARDDYDLRVAGFQSRFPFRNQIEAALAMQRQIAQEYGVGVGGQQRAGMIGIGGTIHKVAVLFQHAGKQPCQREIILDEEQALVVHENEIVR